MSQRIYLNYRSVGHKCNCQTSIDEVACPSCVYVGRQQEYEQIIELLKKRFQNLITILYDYALNPLKVFT
jgi:hypothetical protein